MSRCNPPSLAAIVLAGGQSSRMGQDKALLSVQGVPLLRHVCQAALQCASIVYVVTPWPERYQFTLPPASQVIQEHPLPGESLPHGPLVGFAQGLAQVHTEWVLLLACDLPYIRAEPLQQWSRELNVLQQQTAFLPRTEKGWDALCGFYRRDCLPRLVDSIQQGNRSFQRWLAQECVKEIEVDDHSLLFNCNTPEDWRSLDNGEALSER